VSPLGRFLMSPDNPKLQVTILSGIDRLRCLAADLNSQQRGPKDSQREACRNGATIFPRPSNVQSIINVGSRNSV